MKRTVAILLILLLMLNVVGYYGFFAGLKYHNALQANQRLDNDLYDESDAITLKVPLSIPYYGNTDFERVNGEIEHNGEFYRLIKQKFSNDTLYIVCIKDLDSKRIHGALVQYVKTFSDQTDDDNTQTIPSFIKDYVSTSFRLGTATAGWSLGLSYPVVENPTFNLYLTHNSPPPEA